jgi:hypothetical protein
MLMYYVHKRNLVNAVPEGENLEDYVSVKKVETPRIRTISPFEEAYARQLVEFDSLNQEEDDEYITGTKDLISNKAL